MHDQPPLPRPLLGDSPKGVGGEVGKRGAREGTSCMACRALFGQVGRDDIWATQGGAKVGGGARCVCATVSDVETKREAMREVGSERGVRVGMFK